MVGNVKPANPPNTILREIIQASVDEARAKRNHARLVGRRDLIRAPSIICCYIK
jgi:hypothetical protein